MTRGLLKLLKYWNDRPREIDAMRKLYFSHPPDRRWRVLAVLLSLVLTLPAQASFHFMQIEQVIGGVNGDTTAQAIQLRMRSGGQNLVAGTTLVAYDAAGNNPITLITLSSNVTSGTAGARILIATPNFASHQATPIAADFTMDPIPAGYLASGRLTYQHPQSAPQPLWSLSWGGANYTGPNTGATTNDADGNFAPPYPGVLPSSSVVALQFQGVASALSTNNAADYQLSTASATFVNNHNQSTILIEANPTPTPPPNSIFGNISTRLRVETGDNALIGGFIITGTQQKRVIVRAIGPSLPLMGALADPTLELRNSAGLIRANDNWRSDQEQEIIATTIPPSSDQESAVVENLAANGSAYTGIVRGANDVTGIGVVEAYDLDPSADSKLANISTRGLVQTGSDVLIGGLIVVGQSSLHVIVRAIGPSLPLPGALGDPTLELHDGNGALIAANNDWRSDQEQEIIGTGIPPTSDLESAIVRDLPPGGFTAIVRDAHKATGIAVVEAYALN